MVELSPTLRQETTQLKAGEAATMESNIATPCAARFY